MAPPPTQPAPDPDKPLVLLADPMILESEPELSARFRPLPLADADAAAPHRRPLGGHRGRPRRAPGVGAGGGLVRRRRPHRPRRVPAPRDPGRQRRARVLRRRRRLRRRPRGRRAPPRGGRRRLRPARRVGVPRRVPSRHQGEREARGDRGARPHRHADHQAPVGLRLRGVLHLPVAEAVGTVQVLPDGTRPGDGQRRAGAVVRAHGGDAPHREPRGVGGAGRRRRASQRRPWRAHRRAGARALPAGRRCRRCRARCVRERAACAAGALRHGQRRAVRPQGRAHRRVPSRRAGYRR